MGLHAPLRSTAQWLLATRSAVPTPALMFGQLHSLPLTAAASSWVSVNAPAGSCEPFTIVLGCSNDATPLQNGAQNRFVFNPPVLSFDPALPGTRNQTFSYPPTTIVTTTSRKTRSMIGFALC